MRDWMSYLCSCDLDVGEIFRVVLLVAEVLDRTTEEAELDSHLDQHGEVSEAHRLEGRDGSTGAVGATLCLRAPGRGLAGSGHADHDVADPVPVLVVAEGLARLQHVRVLVEVLAAQLDRTRVL